VPTVEVLSRSHFRELPEATARPIADNAWEIRIPRTTAVQKRCRVPDSLEGWDGVVFAIDGEQTAPAVASAIDAHAVTVTVWVLEG
jgi:hypothetical protein